MNLSEFIFIHTTELGIAESIRLLIIEFASRATVSALEEFTHASEIFEMIVAGTTNLGYMTGEGVFRIKSNTKILNSTGRGDRISKKLGGEFLHKGHPGLSVTNDGEFCFSLDLMFQSDTIHPFLNASKTLSELSNTGIKVPGIEC